MKIIYKLETGDAERVEFRYRLISDRQDRPSFVRAGIGEFGEPYYGYHRRDMYWIICSLDGAKLGTFCVEPSLKNPRNFAVHPNYLNIIGKDVQVVQERATEYFKNSPAYQNQVIWTTSLAEKIRIDREKNFRTTLVQPAAHIQKIIDALEGNEHAYYIFNYEYLEWVFGTNYEDGWPAYIYRDSKWHLREPMSDLPDKELLGYNSDHVIKNLLGLIKEVYDD
jgi:hypothetical protein